MKRPLFLLLLSIHLSTCWALKLPFGLILSAFFQKKNHVRIEPWEKAVDPNPGPTLDELEHTSIEQIDAVLDHVTGNHGGIVIHRYKPERWWLWKQWYSTVLYHSLSNALINMCGTLVFCLVARYICHGDWNIAELPDREHPFIARLVLFDKIWKNMMGLVTFLLTFFVGQAYGLWRNFYDVARGIQGRMQDINLLLATHATRNAYGEYTPESRAYLQDVASKLRAFHLLMWANNASRFRVLLTYRGMSRLVARGVITNEENDTLDRLNIAKSQKHCSYLEWVVTKTIQARKLGHIEYGAGFEQIFLEKITLLRGAYGTIRYVIMMWSGCDVLVGVWVDLFGVDAR